MVCALRYGRCHVLADAFFTDGTTAYDALEKGFDDLMCLCDIVLDKFIIARDDFDATQKP